MSRALALTRSLSPAGLDQRSLWCGKSQNASGSTQSYSLHHLPRDSPQTQAHCPTVCIPGQKKCLQPAAHLPRSHSTLTWTLWGIGLVCRFSYSERVADEDEMWSLDVILKPESSERLHLPGWPTVCAARHGSSSHLGWECLQWTPAPPMDHLTTPPPYACGACPWQVCII